MVWGMLKKLVDDGLIIACGLFMLDIVVPIAIYGEVTSYEDNHFILFIEIVVGILIVAFGITKLIRDYMKRWHSG